eukprot:10692979-Karenia_brevis.AAC.1
MIDQSAHAAWLMLHSIPRKEIRLISPTPMYAHFQGGKLSLSSPNMNLGPEHVDQKRKFYNLNGMLPNESLTKAKRPGFIRAVVHLMPDDMVVQLYKRADTKSLKPAYWKVHGEHQSLKDEQHAKKSKHNADANAGTKQSLAVLK